MFKWSCECLHSWVLSPFPLWKPSRGERQGVNANNPILHWPGVSQPVVFALQLCFVLSLLQLLLRTHWRQSVTVKVPIKHKINWGRETLGFMWSSVKAFLHSKASCCWFLSFDLIPWIVFAWVRGGMQGSREAMLYSRIGSCFAKSLL